MNTPAPRYQRIMIATDLSEAAAKAAAEAVRIARRHEAELHVVHVDVIAQASIEGFDRAELASHVHGLEQTAMSAVGKACGVSYSKTVTAIVRDTSEAAGILRYASAKGIDLIVTGTHGRGALSELILGSVAQQVVRDAPVSVLVVGPRPNVPAPPSGKAVFVAPVDLSARSKVALTHAGALAVERGAHLIVLHAIGFARAHLGDLSVPAQAEEDAREQLETFVAKANLPVEPEILVGLGPADEVTLDIAARRSASLIVIAPSSHSGFDRLLLGSVTKCLIRSAPCPVLVYRSGAGAVQSQAA